MSRLPTVHLASVRGRARTDPGLLLLVGLVVALTTLLVAALGPLTERTSDRAVAAAVRDAGPRAAVVATLPEAESRGPGERRREPDSVQRLRDAAASARAQVPDSLARVLQPGVTSLTTPALHLLDGDAGRYLRLAFLDTPAGAPPVRLVAGAAPQASTDQPRLRLAPDAGPWTVQVALSQQAADALGLAPGDVVPAEDEQRRALAVRVSGVFRAVDPGAEVWQAAPQLLEPTQGTSDGLARTSAAALVTAASAPDLVLAVAPDDLTARTVLTPRPSRVHLAQVPALTRAVAGLASASVARGGTTWDSLLAVVLDDVGLRVAAARGQAEVLLVGLLVGAGLVLVLAAQLLVTRRAGPVGMARERGASLPGIGAELLLEAGAVALAGAGVGLLAARLLVGDADVVAALPVVLVACAAGPVLGVLHARRSGDVRRTPANRSVRRAAARADASRRLLLEGVVLAGAAASLVALHQRGVLGAGPLVGGAPTWWAVVGALVVLRLVPPLVGVALRLARGARGGVALFTAARLARTAGRALPLVVVTVCVAQLTVAVALAATERAGQADGALLDVGGDARLVAGPGVDVDALAREVRGRAGVRAVAVGRVVDGVRVASRRRAVTARLVVVDAASYEQLLAADGALPDAPALDRLTAPAGGGGAGAVPALLLGGDAALRDGLSLRWEDDVSVDLAVVGVAPRVGSTTDPVLVVDTRALAGGGVQVAPDTLWAVGPGAGAALGDLDRDGDVTLAGTVLAARRAAPLAAGLVHLAVAGSALLLLLAVLGVTLASASDAPARAESAGRLRSLGLAHAGLRRVVLGELLAPVVLAALAGLLLGATSALATFGDLSLERVTGQESPPTPVVPWWSAGSVVVLVVVVLLLGGLETARLRRTSLAALLRGGDRR